MEIILIVAAASLIAMGTGLWVDLQVCRKIREKMGRYSLSSIALQSLSHSLFLAPTLTPLGLVGFFVPFALGIVAAGNEKMYRLCFISFVVVFVVSLCIHGLLKALNRKTEPAGTGQPM